MDGVAVVAFVAFLRLRIRHRAEEFATGVVAAISFVADRVQGVAGDLTYRRFSAGERAAVGAEVDVFVAAIGLCGVAEFHADAWPDLIECLRRANMRNYSLFIAELNGQKYVFGYFEYAGTDFEADQKLLGDSPAIHRWMEAMTPCDMIDGADGTPIECHPPEMVFHMK